MRGQDARENETLSPSLNLSPASLTSPHTTRVSITQCFLWSSVILLYQADWGVFSCTHVFEMPEPLPTLPAPPPHLTLTPHPSTAHPPVKRSASRVKLDSVYSCQPFPSPAFVVIVLFTENPSPLAECHLPQSTSPGTVLWPLELASSPIFWLLSVDF